MTYIPDCENIGTVILAVLAKSKPRMVGNLASIVRFQLYKNKFFHESGFKRLKKRVRQVLLDLEEEGIVERYVTLGGFSQKPIEFWKLLT